MLPERIGEAAKEGDLETIRAYFEDDSNGERDVDDVCESENSIMWRTLMTPLMWCAAGDGDRVTPRNVEVARYLLSRGASIDEIHTVEGGRRLPRAPRRQWSRLEHSLVLARDQIRI